MEDFSLIKDADYYILKRSRYPRFEALLDLRNPLPEIKKIKYFEPCSAEEFNAVIEDIGIWFNKYQQDPESRG